MHAEIPPWFEDFLKSATGQLPRLPSWNLPSGQLPKLPTCACRNPPSLQIFWNLPLDRYLQVLLEIPPTSFQIFWNLPQDSYLSYLYVLAEIPPPQFADLTKSATGQLPKLPSWNLPFNNYLSYLHVLAEIPPLSLQIFWNLPFNNGLSYLHVFAEIPPILQIFWNLPLVSYLSYLLTYATGQSPKLPTCAYRNPPWVCRFSEICHWTLT